MSPALHSRQFHHPGQLASIGQMYIVDSLSPNDRQTGRRLREDVEDLLASRSLTVPVTFRRSPDRKTLFEELEELRANVECTRRYPILHLECHGTRDGLGLVLCDGSFVAWNELKQPLQQINSASRFNLMLVLGSCNGAYLSQIARMDEMAPFCALLGPNREIFDVGLLQGLRAFYLDLFVQRDATEAFNALRRAVPDFPYFFTTAQGLFQLGFGAYLAEETTDERLAERARNILDTLPAECGITTIDVSLIAQTLKTMERRAFETLQRTFFALEEFPENTSRLALSYDSIALSHRAG
jgi:hypothetical protein